jgi:hypothetical protein
VTLFSIPDFVKGWRDSTFEQKQIVIVRILLASFWVGFTAAIGKSLVVIAAANWLSLAVGCLTAIGAGCLTGAACMALAAISIGLPISIPKFLYDEMAKDESLNAQNAPKK